MVSHSSSIINALDSIIFIYLFFYTNCGYLSILFTHMKPVMYTYLPTESLPRVCHRRLVYTTPVNEMVMEIFWDATGTRDRRGKLLCYLNIIINFKKSTPNRHCSIKLPLFPRTLRDTHTQDNFINYTWISLISFTR